MTKPLPKTKILANHVERLKARNAELKRQREVLRVTLYQSRLSFQEGFAAGLTAFAKLMASRRENPGKSLDLLTDAIRVWNNRFLLPWIEGERTWPLDTFPVDGPELAEPSPLHFALTPGQES